MSQESINDLAVTTLGMLHALNNQMGEASKLDSAGAGLASEYAALRSDLAMHLSSSRTRIINLGVRANALIEQNQKGSAS